ncbi:MAG: penicillin-binding protein 2 [Candidatus Omnitrophica bacterium]|nr:penicillin-binding protein 2 [Candidatus Omnitrophota bacterium]
MRQSELGSQFSQNFSWDGIKKIYAVGFCLLILVLFFYQIVNGNYYRRRAQNNYVRLIPVSAIRGSIFDRNGELLAYDRATFNISVIPHQIKKTRDSLFANIAEFLSCDIGLIHKNYRKNLRNPFSPVNIILNINKNTALRLKETFEDSILISSQPQRYYPYPRNFAHLIGYVKKAAAHYKELKKYGYKPLERVGFLGVEQYYDTYLRGEDGGDLIEVDAFGQTVGFLGEKHSRKGADIYLTIDSQAQNIANETLEKKRGTIILMDSLTGEIMVLCSSPSFNSNNFITGKNVNELFNDKSSPLLNRAIQANYPLGSIFKPLLALAALDEETITADKTFLCEGKVKIGLAKFRCWDTHGIQNLDAALTHSCNSYFYNLGLAAGPNILSHWAKKFGLDSLTGIDLPYEKKGFVPTVRWKKKKRKQNWFAGDTLNFSIGQGFIEATPLEAMIAINVFASDGYLVKPHILKKINHTPSELPSKTYLRSKKENLREVKKSLRNIVSSDTGTAAVLNSLKLELSGKTGTAQTKGPSHGWFIGYFPYKKSKYTICVFLENGGSSHAALRVVYKFLKRVKEQNLL